MEELERLYRQNKGKYFKIVRRILRNDETKVEDIIHSAFTRAVEYWPTFDPNRGKIENWFYSILFNEVYRSLRKDKRDKTEDITNFPYIEGIDYNKAIENYNTIQSTINTLGEGLVKSTLVTIYVQGYSIQEASGICKTSESNIKQICRRFKKGLEDG